MTENQPSSASAEAEAIAERPEGFAEVEIQLTDAQLEPFTGPHVQGETTA
jgi:hypothetical protein